MHDSIYRTGEHVRKNPTYHVEESPWKAEHILSMLDRRRLKPRTVCEVGCGAGEILRQLQLKLPPIVRFEGYEVSPQAYALSRQRENERLRFHCSDFLTTTSNRYDLLLRIDVFEHVEDYMTFLRSLQARAEFKIFHIPLDISAQSVMRGHPIMRVRKEVGHLHYFTKETALASLTDTGYQVIDWFYTAGALDNPQSTKARMAALPRKMLAWWSQDLAARLLGGYSLLALAR